MGQSQQEALRALKVPRYTSYPTAPHFDGAIDGDVVARWLSVMPEGKKISLYFHIPYCREMCWFCGCFTKVTKSDSVIVKYVALLTREIAMVAEKLGKCAVSHIHFGGGSPTILAPALFLEIMDVVGRSFDVLPDAEIAVEIDPRTLSEAKVAAYASAGVNRVSMGIQDFDEKVQVAIHRIQPYHVAHQAVMWLREYGIDRINLDLVYGLPHQTVNSVRDTVELTVTLKPQRIALFGYAHVPWMKKHQRLIDEASLPDGGVRAQMLESASVQLVAAGYETIGFDHFALPDDALSIAQREKRLHRNFQGYTTDEAETLIGFGISSIGHLPQGYVQNMSDIHAYEKALNAGNLPIVRGFALTEDDRLRAEIIEGLMCNFEIDLGLMAQKYHVTLQKFDVELARMNILEQQGLVICEGDVIRVTSEGRALVRVVASVFDVYLEQSAARHSVAV